MVDLKRHNKTLDDSKEECMEALRCFFFRLNALENEFHRSYDYERAEILVDNLFLDLHIVKSFFNLNRQFKCLLRDCSKLLKE